jgi:formate hydrogenlyase subunit 3/multisubunit Na+/H+ antiporter MnhD subunit
MPACLVLVALSITMGLGAGFMMDYAIKVADQLMNPQIYIDAVLNFAD